MVESASIVCYCARDCKKGLVISKSSGTVKLSTQLAYQFIIEMVGA